jgi:regulator of cell morphogenesis and NO signaling
MSTTASETLGRLVAERPQRARLLEQLGLDYCCGGQRTLEEACHARGLDPCAVRRRLDEEDRASPAPLPDGSQRSVGELIDDILQRHHTFLRRDLPRLQGLMAKVRAAHVPRHPELAEMECVLAGLVQELAAHMLKEEHVLFPWIRALQARSSVHAGPCGTVRNPIRVMEHEHQDAGAALQRLRTLSRGYTPPADACASYRALLAGLAELEADLHLHIHKENNLLFPAAAALEGDL